MGARREVVSAVMERYRSARRAEKGRILDALCATGWHRKHAVRALRQREGVPYGTSSSPEWASWDCTERRNMRRSGGPQGVLTYIGRPFLQLFSFACCAHDPPSLAPWLPLQPDLD